MRHPSHIPRRKRRTLPGPRPGPRKAAALFRSAAPRERAAARPRRRQEAWGELHRTVLPNGLRVLTAPAPGLRSAMIALYVRAGSRHERAERNGVSHFLEHLFFRGSIAWPDTVRMNAAVESAGGSLNGITARDHGCYFTPIHPGELGADGNLLAVLVDIDGGSPPHRLPGAEEPVVVHPTHLLLQASDVTEGIPAGKHCHGFFLLFPLPNVRLDRGMSNAG